MKKDITMAIKVLEEHGISNVKVIALVSHTSSEVIFYGEINGEWIQSNNMVEAGKISSVLVDDFYNKITKIIRRSDKFEDDKMNIVKADIENMEMTYDDTKCKTYKMIREWEENIN